MVEANVKIITELKAFLETACNDAQTRVLFTFDATDFSRTRKLPLDKLVSILINLPKRTLSIELQEFFDTIGASQQSCTKGAFSLQRTKLNPIFFKLWNKWLVDSFYHWYGDKVKKWKGFTVLSVDGSTAYLFDKGDIKERFGTQNNQYKQIPMAQIVQIEDVLNNLTLWSSLFPSTAPEQYTIAKNIHQIPVGSLTLFDRGYPSYTLMYLMQNQESPRHFVMRCRSNFNNEVRSFLRSRKNSKIIELKPEKRTVEQLMGYGFKITQNTLLKVRMVKIKLPTGEAEILLTNLYDEALYRLQDLKDLYAMRWRIETAFNKHKNQQQMEVFTGHRAICIEQDHAAGIFTSNLQSLIEKQTAQYVQRVNEKRKLDYRVNQNVTWAALKHNVVKLFLEKEITSLLLYLQQAFERNLEPVRPGRSYPRVISMRRTKGKYQTYTNYRRSL